MLVILVIPCAPLEVVLRQWPLVQVDSWILGQDSLALLLVLDRRDLNRSRGALISG